MEDLFQKAPYNRFAEFIALKADRFSCLCSVLEENGLAFEVLSLEGKRHILLNGQVLSRPRPALMTAHYDRAPGSTGANDNSAAVFMLVEAAMDVFAGTPEYKTPHCAFIFTDKEELFSGEGIDDQGAYSLARFLREKEPEGVFCFDACGTGDVLVVSTAAEQLLKDSTSPGAASLRRRVRNLRKPALAAARSAGIEKIITLPTPLSDDAGFLKAGLAAQTITALPSEEAAAFALLLRSRPDAGPAFFSLEKASIPKTWQILNSPEDKPIRLTARYWPDIVCFIKALMP